MKARHLLLAEWIIPFVLAGTIKDRERAVRAIRQG